MGIVLALGTRMSDPPSKTSLGFEPSPSCSGPLDSSLAERALAGDPDARAEVEGRLGCVPRILGFRNGRAGRPFGPEELGDLAQDVYVLIWSKLPGFEGRSRLETWVYRICVFEFMNALRKKQRQKARTADLGPDTNLDDMVGRQAQDESRTRFEGLRAAMDQLLPQEEAVLTMKHHDDLTFEEIGKALGLTASGAKHQYYKALRRLTTLLKAKREGHDE